MNTSALVEVFFIISVIVFASSIYIIVPISLLNKKGVFKERSILHKKIADLKKRWNRLNRGADLEKNEMLKIFIG